jgi:predicted aminopeptidase
VRLPIIAALASLSLLLSSCYVGSQGLHYLGLLSRARPAAKALADPHTPAASKDLIERAARIETFGRETLGLSATRNFKSIVELDADTLVHVVQATGELSFERHLWYYPLVGKLPYRGFFEKAEAEKEAATLRKQGLDVIVRSADAFSTLGWLSDPLWSFMATYDETELADLILHELTHATAFRRDGESWNEEIATFVGREGSRQWVEREFGPDSKELREAEARRRDAEAYVAFLRETGIRLEAVYSSGAPDTDKRRLKAQIIAERAKEYSETLAGRLVTDRYRNARLDGINNAWLDLYRLYEGEPVLYSDYYESVSGSKLSAFIADMAALAKGRDDPKNIMRDRLAGVRK